MQTGIKVNNLKQTCKQPRKLCASEIFENIILLHPLCLGNPGTDGASLVPEQHWAVLDLLQILPSCSWLKERVSEATFLVFWPHLCLRAQSPIEADTEWQTDRPLQSLHVIIYITAPSHIGGRCYFYFSKNTAIIQIIHFELGEQIHVWKDSLKKKKLFNKQCVSPLGTHEGINVLY